MQIGSKACRLSHTTTTLIFEMDAAAAKSAIKSEALALGFDAVGIAGASASPERRARLSAFVEKGRHGDMAWMAERLAERADPQTLWPAARTVVMVALNYGPNEDPRAALARRSSGAISVYARGKDYHDVMRPRLKALGRFMIDRFGGEIKVFVDTAPVMEKPLAADAGLGWQGKHTNLVSRTLGSWTFLGAVFTTLELAPDPPEADHCGSCRACLDACPTDAFPAPYQLDARRCISYLTIEHKGPIPEAFRKAIGNRIYGCDDCLAACPWNKFAQHGREAKLAAREDCLAPPLAELAALDDGQFRSRYSGSPIKRIGRDRFVRNVMIAIGNSGDAALRAAAETGRTDASSLVAEAAAWATQELR